MDFSKHVKNQTETYYAYYEYEALPEEQRENQKGELQCYDCNVATMFVKPSTSGNQAHFRIYKSEEHEEHEKHCKEIKKINQGVKSRRDREEAYYAEAIEKIQNDTRVIQIDCTQLAQFEKLKYENKSKPKTITKRLSKKKLPIKRKTHVINSDKILASRKNLVQLLKFCIYSPKLLNGPGITLKYDGRNYQSNQRIKHLFKINNITNIGIPYFFFGPIRGADENLKCIHVGLKKTKIIIDKPIHDQFWNALEVDKFWQLLEGTVICFGWVNRNENGSYYIKIKDISCIAIIDVKKNPNFKPHVTTEPQRIVCSENEITKIIEVDEASKEHTLIEQTNIGFGEFKFIPLANPEPQDMRPTDNEKTKIIEIDEESKEHAVIEQSDVSYDEPTSISKIPENVIAHFEGSTNFDDAVSTNKISKGKQAWWKPKSMLFTLKRLLKQG